VAVTDTQQWTMQRMGDKIFGLGNGLHGLEWGLGLRALNQSPWSTAAGLQCATPAGYGFAVSAGMGSMGE